MSEINFERDHALGREEVRRRFAEVEQKLNERYGVKLAWHGDAADVKGSGVTGTIEVTDSKVNIRLKLGLMVRPLAGKIREAMEKQIDRALA